MADGKSEQSLLAGNNGIMLFSAGVLSAWVSEWEHQWPVEGLRVSHHLCCCFFFLFLFYFLLQKNSTFSSAGGLNSDSPTVPLTVRSDTLGFCYCKIKPKSVTIRARLSAVDCDTQSLSFSSLAWLGHEPTEGYFPIVHYTSSICYSVIALHVMNIFEAFNAELSGICLCLQLKDERFRFSKYPLALFGDSERKLAQQRGA